MRIPSLLRVLPAALGLGVLVFVPAAQAAETLVLTCHTCDHVEAIGKGLPASTTVRVTLTDVRTGQQLASLAVPTDAQGAFVKRIAVDLFRHPSVEATVWKDTGQVLVVAAHNRFAAPCKDGKMMPMDHMGGMGGMEPDQLAFTGSHTPQLLGLGFGLLMAGTALLVAARRRPGRA